MELVREFWLHGRCPCCGYVLDEWEDTDGIVFYPKTIAEGVRLCGMCVSSGHHEGDYKADLLHRLLPVKG